MAKKKSVPKKAVAKKSNKKLHAPTQELGMWRLAGIAFSELTGTDLDESLDNVLADSDEE